MKNIFKLSLALLFIGCTSIKNNKNQIIPYIVDINAEKAIYMEIAKNSSNNNIVFYIEHLPDSNLKIHMIDSVDKELLMTNRKLFINDKFYPIIFDTDYLFYSKMKNGSLVVSFEKSKNVYIEIPMPTIKEREKNSELYGYMKKTIIIDNSIYWILDKKGKLVIFQN